MIAGLDYNTDIRVGVVRLLYRCLVELQSHVNRLQLNCLKRFSLIEGFCGNVGVYCGRLYCCRQPHISMCYGVCL